MAEEKANAKPTESSNSNNKTLLLAGGIFAAVVAIVVVVVLAVVLLGGGSSNLGKDIPSDWTKYETDAYTVGHPEDWGVSESGDNVTIAAPADEGAEPTDIFSALGTASVSITPAQDEENLSVEEMIGYVQDGKCSDLEDLMKEQMDLSEVPEGTKLDISSKNVTLNDADACEIDFDVSMSQSGISFEAGGTVYYVVSPDGDASYSAGVMFFGEKPDNFGDAMDVVHTFRMN